MRRFAKIQALDHRPSPDRRQFLVAAGALTGGLVVGFSPHGASAGAPRGVRPFEAWLSIAPDNTVTILSAHLEMGQGIHDGIATLVAEELGAAWSQMRARGASGNTRLYGNLEWGGMVQGTGGSTGMASSWERYRIAAATAREMLKMAASALWRVPAAEISASEGVLRHPGGRSATFGDLAERAASFPVPGDVMLKSPEQWQLIGKDALRRLDTGAKSRGALTFTADLNWPGLLSAVPIHPPLFGAVVQSFDATRARALPGVVDVVETPRGLAVVGRDMWSALRARDAVEVVWDMSRAELRSSAQLLEQFRALALQPGDAVAQSSGNIEAGLAGASRTLEATFTFPYLAHATLEPLNAAVRRRGDMLEVWGGHQAPDIYQAVAAHVAGIAPSKVRLHVMPTGGSFGRRAVFDADVVAEAVAVAKALGFRHPVRLQWTREDDMRGGRYRPLFVHHLKAGLDRAGRIVAWQHRLVGQSIARGTPFESAMVRNGVDGASVEGAIDLPYAMPAKRVELTTPDVGVPVLWWRAVGHTHTAYAVETFLDQLAAAAGQDPLAFRLAMLDPGSRHAAVLKLAAEKAGWGQPLPDGRFRGLALAESFSSCVAQVAEIQMQADGGFKVVRVVCAIDCGIAVNPDNVRAQMEGGIGFGLGAVLKGAITLDQGRVVEGNYDAYDGLRLSEMPVVEVHIVPSREPPTGVGEPGLPPIGPAVANALFAATGTPRHQLPLRTPPAG